MSKAFVDVTPEQLDAFVRSLGYVPREPIEQCFLHCPSVKGTELRLVIDDDCEVDGRNQSFYLVWLQGDEPSGSYISDAPVVVGLS